MYLKAAFEGKGEIIAWIERELEGLPVNGVARRWRQEIYLETPFDLSGEKTSVVERGSVAFWPPGRALCFFYGYSQPYSPVIKLGSIVGSPDLLSSIEEGLEVHLATYVDYGKEGELARALRESGFKSASHSWEEEEKVGVLVEGVDSRVGVEVDVNEDGYYSQTQSLTFFDNSPPTMAFFKTLAGELAPTGIRLDVNEEGYIILSCFSQSFDELVRDLKRLLSAYVYAERAMVTFYSVRRPV
ncbi:MAG: cyclophilin-like fold protein [Thermofilaceae archaeon]|nr:cyclophilin-like fold protein [Thermofilaceae archaeon]MCX8180387.1 cyclophilin-like fold protein [Thermofilaceae archaeon]MDW8003922.1 cyclophilin-like fold protein [Thermofilaceae archaeon]